MVELRHVGVGQGLAPLAGSRELAPLPRRRSVQRLTQDPQLRPPEVVNRLRREGLVQARGSLTRSCRERHALSDRLDACRHVFVPRRAGEPVAVLGCRQLVWRDAGLNAITAIRRVIETEPVGK